VILKLQGDLTLVWPLVVTFRFPFITSFIKALFIDSVIRLFCVLAENVLYCTI